jgi:heptosyltransferase-2
LNSFRGKILVIRGGAIGDFILTLPAIAALRQQFAAAHLEVLGYPHIIQLALAGGLVNRIQSIEARALAGFFARHGTLDAGLADYFSEFDLIISYLYDPDLIFETNVRRCTPAQFIAGAYRPDENVGLHATRVFLKALERLAIFEANHVPRLVIPSDSSIPQPASANLIALHPGSGSRSKNWPEAGWVELLHYLVHSTNHDLLLMGGEAEGGRLQRLAAALPPTRTRVAQSLPLTDLARMLQNCTFFIGHDSGISHLAAAVGLPGMVLWGETAEEIWRPPSEQMRIIRHSTGLAGLPAKVVVENFRILIAHSATTTSETISRKPL